MLQRELFYASQGRGGYVTYADQRSEIKFYYEFGGGDCVAIIFIPPPDRWESDTRRPLAERKEILAFVAERALADQVSSGHYRISDQFIELFSG